MAPPMVGYVLIAIAVPALFGFALWANECYASIRRCDELPETVALGVMSWLAGMLVAGLIYGAIEIL